MTVKVPFEIKSIINNLPYNTTKKKSAFKIYAALYIMNNRRNNNGFFPAPSDYLKSVNSRYNEIINEFIKNKIIEPYTRPFQDTNDIFNSIHKKYYDVNRGICMKYRFLYDVEKGENINVDMSINRYTKWYSIIEKSLLETGFEINIKRDTYGRRVWHSAIFNYKDDFKGYYTIDGVASQPRLLFDIMNEKGIIDKEYNDIFNNDKDFYSELTYKLNLESRKDAKELFMYWINSSGYVPNFKIHKLFPNASEFIKSIKKGNYKDGGSYLQRIESKIWIDNILSNIPCEFALPIHDCVIVKPEDVDKVLEYCVTNYPKIRFKKELLK